MTTIYKVTLFHPSKPTVELEFSGDDALEQATAAYANGQSEADSGHIIAYDSETPNNITYLNSFDDNYDSHIYTDDDYDDENDWDDEDYYDGDFGDDSDDWDDNEEA